MTLPPNIETRGRLGEDGVIDVLFRPYTKKMWGLELEELDPKIIKRIPIRDDNNQYYFPNDDFQALPKDGYTSLVSNIVKHDYIKVSLSTSFTHDMESKYSHIFNSMPIDEYFEYCYGPLPYRSIKFTHLTFPTSTLFPSAVVNFTHHGPHTRVTEWRHHPVFKGSFNLMPIVALDLALFDIESIKVYHSDLMLTVSRQKGYYPVSFKRFNDIGSMKQVMLSGSINHDPIQQYRTLNSLWRNEQISGDARFLEVMEMGLDLYLCELERVYGNPLT